MWAGGLRKERPQIDAGVVLKQGAKEYEATVPGTRLYIVDLVMFVSE